MTSKPNFVTLSRFVRRYCSKSVDKKQTLEEKIAGMTPQELSRNMVKVSEWNKTLLVFSGRFKAKKDIPEYLPYGTLDKERNWVRVKVANYLMGATVIGCFIAIWSGKQAEKRGDTIEKGILDWHKDYNERARREEEAARAAGKTA